MQCRSTFTLAVSGDAAAKASMQQYAVCLVSTAALSELLQVKQTMARIKQVLTERASAEPNERVRRLAMDKINAN